MTGQVDLTRPAHIFIFLYIICAIFQLEFKSASFINAIQKAGGKISTAKVSFSETFIL